MSFRAWRAFTEKSCLARNLSLKIQSSQTIWTQPVPAFLVDKDSALLPSFLPFSLLPHCEHPICSSLLPNLRTLAWVLKPATLERGKKLRHEQCDRRERMGAVGRSTSKPLQMLESDIFHTSPAWSPTVPVKENSEWSGISFEEGALYSEVAYVSCEAWAAVVKDFFFLLNSNAL